jgi:hypothetical protein
VSLAFSCEDVLWLVSFTTVVSGASIESVTFPFNIYLSLIWSLLFVVSFLLPGRENQAASRKKRMMGE